jgi:hypothetical protein
MSNAQGWWIVVELGVLAVCALVRLIVHRG